MKYALVLSALILAGCGATVAQQHVTLNTITEIADPTYDLAVASCDVARDAVIARAGTTAEEDDAAMARVNAICDPMIEGFEELRGLQISARAYIDNGVEGAVATAIGEALQLWQRLQALVPSLRALR